MVHYQRLVIFNVLKEGAAFRLQADGLERTYQVEIGTVLWPLLANFQHLTTHGELAGWLQVLGPRGPWIVERIIGVQEFPQGMDLDGKVSMPEACMRRACMDSNGEVSTKVHQHVRERPVSCISPFSGTCVPRLGRGALGPETLRQLRE